MGRTGMADKGAMGDTTATDSESQFCIPLVRGSDGVQHLSAASTS
jgi:hypothetical protein